MSFSEIPLLTHMTDQIGRWEVQGDQRALFLSCYCMMTSNMFHAIHQQEFEDSIWVDRLLHRFADYYFEALEAFERDPASAPEVWQIAHYGAHDPHLYALQRLLLGVNAHINYDLVLTLVDLLEDEWTELREEKSTIRYVDYCQVNAIIGRTIDAVQDELIEPAMPVMRLLDQVLGRLDEMLISRLITSWREVTWQHAVSLLESADADDRARLTLLVEQHAMRIAHNISFAAPNEPEG